MKRLFAFGCSFTNYRWPTWVDCLEPEFDHTQNWGQSGAGNHYIFNSVIECDQRNRFSPNDTVIVCWSGTHRDDWYVNNKWQTLGNMHSCPIYNPEYLKTHVDDRGYIIRDLAYISAVKTLLENSQATWRFLSMCTLTAPDDVALLYKNVLDCILPGYDITVFKNNWPKPGADPHPSPAEHLAYLDTVLPGWVTKSETRVKMHEASINLNKNPNYSGMTKVTRL